MRGWSGAGQALVSSVTKKQLVRLHLSHREARERGHDKLAPVGGALGG